jgi:hypothetical protein
VITRFANAGIYEAANLAAPRSAERLTRWPSSDKVNRDVLEQPDEGVPGPLLTKVKVEGEARKVVTMSLQRPGIVINGSGHRPTCSFNTSTQTTGTGK